MRKSKKGWVNDVIKSMTGYGRCEELLNGRNITVEIRSVNHRYFEYTCRVSRGYGFLEDKLKRHLQEKLSRGKVDAYISINTVDEQDAEVLLNHSLASGYLKALHELSERYELKDDITVSVLARNNELFTVRRAPEDEDEIWEAVKIVADKALDGLVQMRLREGERMRDDVLSRANTILGIVEKIERQAPNILKAYQQRLSLRLTEMLGDVKIDEQRLLTEAAIFADKVATEEETVRLKSHFEQFSAMIDSSEAVGRKLDFLVQEMNREINTIGSKCQDVQITRMVVDMKAELEKIREQIQNIE